MKRIFAIILSLLSIQLFFSDGHVFSSPVDGNFIRVGLTSPIKYKESVKLYSDKGFSIYNKNDILNELKFIDKDYIKICTGEGNEIVIKDNEENILFSYNQEEELIISSKKGYDKKVKVEDKNYRGYLFFKIVNNSLSVINYIHLEDYLYGVVPMEMPASFEMEALKAQAVAARTYALKNINKHGKEGYDLCDTTHCQVYGGLDGEHERTNGAVDETEGIVITYNGKVIDALYHSNSGGHTEDSVEVWGNSVPYLIGVKDEFSIGYPNSTWEIRLTSDHINTKLIQNNIYIGELIDMEILASSPNGRVSKLKVIGTSGETVLNKSKIREILGPNELKSTWFTIKKEGDRGTTKTVYAIDGESLEPISININDTYILGEDNKSTPSKISNNRLIIRGRDSNIEIENRPIYNTGNFIIEGKGYGHGLGMSQWGAQGMAKLGYSYEDILKHYYTDVEIIKQ